MSLRYTLGRFKFHVIVSSFSFLQTIVNVSNSIELTNLVLGTNTQQHNVQERSLKGTNGNISQTITLTDIITGTKVQYNKQHLMK